MPEVIFFTNLVPELAEQVVAPAPADWDVSIHPHNLPEADKARLAAGADFLILFPSTLEASCAAGSGQAKAGAACKRRIRADAVGSAGRTGGSALQ